MNTKKQEPHKPTVEYLTTYMHENFVTKEEFYKKIDDVENHLNKRIDKLETRIDKLELDVKDIKTSTNLIIDILVRNGMK